MRVLALAVALGLVVLPTDGSASCVDGCGHPICVDATRGFIGTVVSRDVEHNSLEAEVEIPAGLDPLTVGERIAVDGLSLPQAFPVGSRLIVLQRQSQIPPGEYYNASVLPLEGDDYDCYDNLVPAQEVLAAALASPNECRAKEREWEPPCNDCGCSADSGRSNGAIALLGGLALWALQRRPSARRGITQEST